MALENLRSEGDAIVIDMNDPEQVARYADLLREADENQLDLAMYRGEFYVPCTREPASFATKADRDHWITTGLRVGDYVELDRHRLTEGVITEIGPDGVRIHNKDTNDLWRFDKEFVVEKLYTWTREES
jgi:hypothetical protein